MNFFTSSICDLLIPIAETSLSSASGPGCDQPDVRALNSSFMTVSKPNITGSCVIDFR